MSCWHIQIPRANRCDKACTNINNKRRGTVTVVNSLPEWNGLTHVLWEAKQFNKIGKMSTLNCTTLCHFPFCIHHEKKYTVH